MDHDLSVTCPRCGKLNVIGSRQCSNCGAPLPQPRKKASPTHRLSRRGLAMMATFGIILALVVLGVIIQDNQPLSYSTFLNSAPQEVELLDQHRRVVSKFYLIGAKKKATATGIDGTAALVSHLRTDNDYRRARQVQYVDNRANGTFTLKASPTMVLNCQTKTGKLKYSGRCYVTDKPSIRYFRWLNSSGGVTK
ncbi:zinc ribbon domain-containing protein [Limosilactobacillus sp.]|jgi:hypothetical protein|uniref:zinc ribbon domain-containing protein n=1 Tax=Limosilactobacillus sp. TaxID=2773925 RepID=UPI0025B80535|nr:zinc ribbon domain-containing protein [Limosilactobacillus sp.]MCH3921466.1 zinc ribbon domain-containing protein [Limosilactobacillus sp.]MCH3928237.1 zinc ribbon domain-containing protein [Limosilactobacillus sp.]